MIAVLEPLIRIPGVRIALLVGSDGVPVVARTCARNRRELMCLDRAARLRSFHAGSVDL